jgi:hypothetical protein
VRPIVEIVIQRRVDQGRAEWPVVIERTVSGSFLTVRSEGTLALDAQTLRAAADPRAYGSLLGQALFQGHVLRAFDRALSESATGPRVLLTVEASELQSIHWERLCAPLDGDTWSLISRDQRVPFSFYLPSTTDRRFPTIGRRDLRALVLVASPHAPRFPQVQPFDVAAAVAAATGGLGAIESKVLAFEGGGGTQPARLLPGAAGPPTLDELCRLLTEEHFSLLHIVCHGWYNSAKHETILYLANPDNSVAPVPSSTIIERLRAIQGPRGLPHFALLSSCESAVPDIDAGSLSGLAQRLVRDLGMR